ncbi:MAG: T9SS type A sorting domain-containing protein [Crocinitomicaceae bacterium]
MTNLSGQTVLVEVLRNDSEFSIKIVDLQSGIYFLSLGSLVSKFVKQ